MIPASCSRPGRCPPSAADQPDPTATRSERSRSSSPRRALAPPGLPSGQHCLPTRPAPAQACPPRHRLAAAAQRVSTAHGPPLPTNYQRYIFELSRASREQLIGGIRWTSRTATSGAASISAAPSARADGSDLGRGSPTSLSSARAVVTVVTAALAGTAATSLATSLNSAADRAGQNSAARNSLADHRSAGLDSRADPVSAADTGRTAGADSRAGLPVSEPGRVAPAGAAAGPSAGTYVPRHWRCWPRSR